MTLVLTLFGERVSVVCRTKGEGRVQKTTVPESAPTYDLIEKKEKAAFAMVPTQRSRVSVAPSGERAVNSPRLGSTRKVKSAPTHTGAHLDRAAFTTTRSRLILRSPCAHRLIHPALSTSFAKIIGLTLVPLNYECYIPSPAANGAQFF